MADQQSRIAKQCNTSPTAMGRIPHDFFWRVGNTAPDKREKCCDQVSQTTKDTSIVLFSKHDCASGTLQSRIPSTPFQIKFVQSLQIWVIYQFKFVLRQIKFIRCQFKFILCHFKLALCRIKFIHSHFKLVTCHFKFLIN